MNNYTFTSESVTEGHPDKIADRISDSILDALLKADSTSKVACETVVTTGQVHVVGEISTSASIDYNKIIRETICEIGYTNTDIGFDGNTCGILLSLDQQSPDIARGVDHSLDCLGDTSDELDIQGAGDQGMMFGYATNETRELMPLPISLAHQLALQLTTVRKNRQIEALRPDGKTQVTIKYENGQPIAIDTVVVSAHHQPLGAGKPYFYTQLNELVIKPVLERYDLDCSAVKIYINPTGNFEIGGPCADAGLTGRKIIVDTYGGMARHGGGAFSGKDPSKVDRSAAYGLRWVAKNVVAAELADKCELQVSYAIGKAKPLNLFVETFGTEKVPIEQIEEVIKDTFDLRPAAINRDLVLRRPIYKETSAYGHFGRNMPDFSWEETNMAKSLQQKVRG